MRGLFVGALLLQLTGCQNACQQLCDRMADYAAECGLPAVSDADIDACVQGQRGSVLEDGDRGVCREFNDPVIIRSQWQCEDLYDYWAIPTAPEGATSRRSDPTPGVEAVRGAAAGPSSVPG
jgi:hypothetical protein